MTEREAAEKRLLAEYIRAWDADETLPDWAIERLWLLARIAIEQAVVPVWEKQQKAWIDGLGFEPDPDDPQGEIPWDAVCAAVESCYICEGHPELRAFHGQHGKPADAEGEK